MENKPVVIIGGGLWGGLLAYRLSQLLPHLDFWLYEKNSSLGGNHTWTFHESDLAPHTFKWIKPLIEKTWEGHQVHFPEGSRKFGGHYHCITSKKFHEIISQNLGKRLKLNNELPLELAIHEGSHVIDTRNLCHFKSGGYQKFLGLELELEFSHNLLEPILMDASVEQKDGYRFVNYLPLDSNKILIRDTRYSHLEVVNIEEMRREIAEVIESRKWKIKKVIREESGVYRIPTSSPDFIEERRVISLAGIFHDTTGEALPDAVRLIEQMTSSSFRFGELKKIVRDFRTEREKNRKFFRLLNRVMFEGYDNHERYKIFQHFYQLPWPLIQRFSRGELQLLDRPRIFMGNPISWFGKSGKAMNHL